MAKRNFEKWGGYPTEPEFKTEEQLQKGCFDWFDREFGAEYRGILYHNYLNPKNARDGNRLRAIGLRKGLPDMSLALKEHVYLELKTDEGVLSADQKKQISKLLQFGNKVFVVCSLRAFKEVVINEIKLWEETKN